MVYTIRCPACAGAGSKTVSKIYADTLDSLRRTRPATCAQIIEDLKKQNLLNGACESTVIHKRMSRMEEWGLVKKVRKTKATRKQRTWQKWVWDLA